MKFYDVMIVLSTGHSFVPCLSQNMVIVIYEHKTDIFLVFRLKCVVVVPQISKHINK